MAARRGQLHGHVFGQQAQGLDLGLQGHGIWPGKRRRILLLRHEKFRFAPESLFDHLFRELHKEVDGERVLTHLQSLEEEGWRQQPNGAIVVITGTLKVPDVMKVIGAMRGLGNLMLLIESLRETGQIEMNHEDRVMMNGLRMLSELGESTESQNATAVGLEVAATPYYRSVASLKKKFLRTEPQDLEGEAKVLLRCS